MAKTIAWGGIDPGQSGCACLLTPQKIHFHDFVSEQKAAAIIDQWKYYYRVKFLLEKVQVIRIPRKDKSDFMGGLSIIEHFGFWRGVLVAFECNFIVLTPGQWQKIMPGKRKKTETTKDRSLMWARKFYPAAGDMLSRKKDNNRADALLMAHYLRQVETGG
jgi:hypothetical protein